MRKNTKIIQITGIKGILIELFVLTCAIAGFIAFPGLVAMNVWNYFAKDVVPTINLYQGILLWGIIALIYFIANKQSFSVSFETPKELNEEELNMLMERIKLQSKATMINKMINVDEFKQEAPTEKTNIEDNVEDIQESINK